MAHRRYRRAAMTAVSITVGVMASAVQAQDYDVRGCVRPDLVQEPDNVYQALGNCALPSANQGSRDLGGPSGDLATGSIGASPAPVLQLPSGVDASAVGAPGGARGTAGEAPGGAVVGNLGGTLGPGVGGSLGGNLGGTLGTGTGGAGGDLGGTTGGDQGGIGPGSQGNPPGSSGGGAGPSSAERNNNGLGNGSEPADQVSYDTEGIDPSNPAHGEGGTAPGETGSSRGHGK